MFRARYLAQFWLVFFGILVQQICFHGVKCSVVLSPSPASATVGEPFTMTCTYNGSETVAGYSWFLNRSTVATLLLPACTPFAIPGPPDSSLYEYACLSNNQSAFTVKRPSNKNNGDSWECAAAAPGYVYSNNVTIAVQVPVSSVTLISPSGSITEDIETSFTCETSVSRPEATIAWYRESSSGQKLEISNNISSTTEDVGDLTTSRSVVKYRPSRGDNGYKMYCEAVNIPGREPVKSLKFQMTVLYTPDGPPQIQNSSIGIHQVIENNQGRLVCIIKGGNPLATLTWSCFNNGLSTVTTGTTVTKTVTWNATRGSDRSCTCLSSHPVAGTQSVSVKVQILYMAVVTSFNVRQNQSQNLPLPITVNENARMEFECTVDSNPGSTIEIKKEDRQLRREENTKTLTFSIPLSTCFDAGVYICSARNQYNLEKSSEKKLNLFVRCSPRPLMKVKENVTGAVRYPVTLTFKGIAYPAPRFTWMKMEGGDWRTLSNSSHFSILISGVDTNLTINKVLISDYGEYQLKIENEIDLFIQPYYLTEEKVPEIPSDFHVVEEHISDTFALLRWKPGFNGGINQTFILMYKRSSDQDWMRKTVLDTHEGLVIYTLHDLISNSEYTVVLFARNQAGDSISSQNITFSTKERRKEISKETSSAIGGGVIGGIVSGIVVLCILVIAVLFYLYRRNIISCKGPLKETSNKSLTGEQGDYSEINTSYLNASHVYDSLQTESGVKADLSNQSVYMRLDKGNNDKDKNVYTELGVTADLSNQSVYMRLDKSNNEKDKNVYTELERQPDHTEGKKKPMSVLPFVVFALVINNVSGCVEDTECKLSDGQAGLCYLKTCVPYLEDDDSKNEHLTFTIRVKYPESVLKAHGRTSLYIRGNGLGLLWIKGKQLTKSGNDMWDVNITYTSSLDGYRCHRCLNNAFLPDNRLQYRIMADDLNDMLGANFVVKLPVSEVSSYFNKVPIFTAYPWFFTRAGSISSFDINSTNLGSKKNITFYTSPSFHENIYKTYPTIFAFDLNFEFINSFKSKIEDPIYPHAVVEEFSLIGFGDFGSLSRGRVDLLTPTTGPIIDCVNGTFEDRCDGCVPVDVHVNVTEFVKYLESDCGQYYNYGGQGDKTLDFLEKEVFPFINQMTSQRLQADNIGIMGYSLGGLMSCYAAWTRPNVYSFAACQSPSFWWPMSSSNHNVTEFDFLNKTLKDKSFQVKRQSQKIYLDAGGEETLDPYRLTQATVEAAHVISSFEHYELNRNVWVSVDPDKEHSFAEWKRRFNKALVTLLPAHGSKGMPSQDASSVG